MQDTTHISLSLNSHPLHIGSRGVSLIRNFQRITTLSGAFGYAIALLAKVMSILCIGPVFSYPFLKYEWFMVRQNTINPCDDFAEEVNLSVFMSKPIPSGVWTWWTSGNVYLVASRLIAWIFGRTSCQKPPQHKDPRSIEQVGSCK